MFLQFFKAVSQTTGRDYKYHYRETVREEDNTAQK